MESAREANDRDEWQAAYEEWDTLTDELWPLEEEIRAEVAVRLTEDTAGAYELALQTARELATDMGYDAVVQGSAEPLYTPPSDEDDEEESAGMDRFDFMMRMRADAGGPNAVHARFASRPVPVLPEGTDITEDVRYELGLD